MAALVLPASAGAQAIQEFPLNAGTYPGGITTGPDGNLWFTAEGTGDIGKMTPQGTLLAMYDVTAPAPGDPTDQNNFVAPVDQITPGPDGRLWFTLPFDDRIGWIRTDGSFATFPVGVPGDPRPEAITLGPDNNLWFTAPGLNLIGRVVPADSPGITTFSGASPGASDIAAADGSLWFTEASAPGSIGQMTTGGSIVNHFAVPTSGSEPSGITPGPGGGLWFTESAANQIGHISTTGIVTEFPGAGAGPSAIEAGRDGALWFTESEANSIGRITTGGTVTNHFALPTPGSEPSDIAAGPDGGLWFSERASHKIGRIESAIPGGTPQLPPAKPLLPKKKKAKRCKVPKVKGLAVKKASKKLRKAKCKFKVKGKGYVVSTKPGAGKRTAKRVQVKAKKRKVAKSSSREGNRP